MEKLLIEAYSINGYYLIPGSAIASSISNALLCLMLLEVKRNQRYYDILLCKAFNNLILSMICIGWQNYGCFICKEQIENTWFFQIFRLVFVINAYMLFLGQSFIQGLNLVFKII